MELKGKSLGNVLSPSFFVFSTLSTFLFRSSSERENVLLILGSLSLVVPSFTLSCTKMGILPFPSHQCGNGQPESAISSPPPAPLPSVIGVSGIGSTSHIYHLFPSLPNGYIDEDDAGKNAKHKNRVISRSGTNVFIYPL